MDKPGLQFWFCCLITMTFAKFPHVFDFVSLSIYGDNIYPDSAAAVVEEATLFMVLYSVLGGHAIDGNWYYRSWL